RHRPAAKTRPYLELLEDRLPPGDWFLGALLGVTPFGPVVNAAWPGADLSAGLELANSAVGTPGAVFPQTATDDFLLDAEFAGPAAAALPKDRVRVTDPTGRQPATAPGVVSQMPPWESSGVPPHPIPGLVPPLVVHAGSDS